MKKLCVLLFVCFLAVSGRSQTSTYILLRHAEKDTMRLDPPLTPAGEQRAQKLVELLKAYPPDAIYSTNYMRTRSTAKPLADKYGKEVMSYDPRKQDEFARALLEMKGKTVIVVGHSNTVPALANLLAGKKLYEDLSDATYNTYFIVTVKDGQTTAQSISY